MFKLAQNWLERLLTRSALAWHALVRRWAEKRVERIYGNLPPADIPGPSSVGSQTEKLAAIVRQHCTRGSTVVMAHSQAAIKLDSAEYAFSALLEELSGIMKTRPSEWTPARLMPVSLQDEAGHRGQAAQAAA